MTGFDTSSSGGSGGFNGGAGDGGPLGQSGAVEIVADDIDWAVCWFEGCSRLKRLPRLAEGKGV